MKKSVGTILLFTLLTTVCFFACGAPEQEAEAPSTTAKTEAAVTIPADDCLAFAAQQLEKTVAEVQDAKKYPFYTKDDGTWETSDDNWWSSGFFAGCLWLMYENTGEAKWKDYAVKWTESLEKQKDNKSDADIGYRMMNSYGNAYRLTGEEKYRKVLVDAAASLASRYSEKIGCVKAYDMDQWKFPILIDHMMNIELMYWGARNGGDPKWKDMAARHSVNTIRTCIREDDSTIQVVDLDPDTGEVIGKHALCGLNGDSSWSRGHGEGIYGFAIGYRETKDPQFLATAKRLADYFIANLPEDHVPYWDFKDPAIPHTIRDASAASMAADGLFEMVSLMDNGPERDTYLNAAVAIMNSLCTKYLADGAITNGILDHASFQTPEKPGADTCLIFGDCNFISALMKYKKLTK